ncbi:MAG: hypothetical protein ACRDF4_07015, partial [Rhabdochlamydiaceae bacterium]
PDHAVSSSNRAKKSVLRTYRMTAELDKILQNDAKSKKTTPNALVGSIFTKYAEWDRFVEKFGFVSISSLFVKKLLESSSEEQIAETGIELGERLPKEMSQFWFKKVDVDSLLALMSLFCTYGGAGQYELETDGKNYTAMARHELGERWSLLLKNLLKQAFFSSIGIVPQFETRKELIVMRFRA